MPIESAFVILVPEAEPLVQPFREKYDASAALGMPAHITLLYPFKAPHEINTAILHDIGECFKAFSPFRFSLSAIKNFPGGLVYLAPEPAEPFQNLTLAIHRRYPENPPYGGAHKDIVPHLTVGQISNEKTFDAVAGKLKAAFAKQPQIHAKAFEVTLMDNKAGTWQMNTVFKLGN